MKRVLLLIMAALLTSGSLTGCGGGSASESTAVNTSSAQSEETTSAEAETVNIYADVPTGNYDGYEFRMMNGTVTWAITQLDAETLDGEVINDAIYNRNRKLEDKLNIKLTVSEADSGSALSKVKNSVSSGDDAYDAASLGAYDIAPASTGNYFVNLNTVDTLDLAAPWWDQVTKENYEIGGRLYMLHGSLQLMYLEGMWVMMFNKQLVTDYGLDNPYELVKSGSWTYEKLMELGSSVAADTNGNGSADIDDMFGIITHTGSSFAFLHGFGEKLIKLDSEGTPYLTENSEHFVNAVENIKKIYGDKTVTGLTSNVGNGDPEWLFPKFSENEALILIEVMGRVRDIRQMEADFGLLPFPKYDESQESYTSYISPASSAICIPMTVAELDRSAAVLENMASMSYETVLPAYYEITLQGKRLRDSESEEMLDILLSNVECELGYVYKWGNINTTYASLIENNKEIASTIDSVRDKVDAGITETLEAYAAN